MTGINDRVAESAEQDQSHERHDKGYLSTTRHKSGNIQFESLNLRTTVKNYA